MDRDFKRLSLDDNRPIRQHPQVLQTADHQAQSEIPPNSTECLPNYNQGLEQGERRRTAQIAAATSAKEVDLVLTTLPPIFASKTCIFTR